MSHDPLANPNLKILAVAISLLQERLEDMDYLMELRLSIARNAGKPGIPWDEVKRELKLT